MHRDDALSLVELGTGGPAQRVAPPVALLRRPGIGLVAVPPPHKEHLMVKLNKQKSLDRLKEVNKKKAEALAKSKSQDSRKVHDTKGKNNHGRRY
jgi:hypothetical protein